MHHYLARRTPRFLRSAAGVWLLLALLLVPVFVLMNNYTFSRQIGLYNAELLTEGKDALFAKMDRFLFDGQMGEGIDKALGGLTMRHSGMLWLLLPAALRCRCWRRCSSATAASRARRRRRRSTSSWWWSAS